MREKVRLMSEEERIAFYKEKNELRKKKRMMAQTPDALIYWGTGKKHGIYMGWGKLVNLQWIDTKVGKKLAIYVKCGAGVKRKIFYCFERRSENQALCLHRNDIIQMYGETSYYTNSRGVKVLAHNVLSVGAFATTPRLTEVMNARENIDVKLWKQVKVKGQEEEINNVLEFLELMSEDDD